MVIENNNLNIPNVTVTEVTTLLCDLYQNAINSDTPLKQLPTPFLWGPAGIGKSEGVHQLANMLCEKTGKRVNVTDVRLLLFSPVDLRGVPVADEHRQFTNWLKPRIFEMDAADDVINILFLDELSAAPQSVQAAAYQITLDRRVGEHTLPENCIVISAGNRTTDQSVSYKMPKALCNRLLHFNINVEFTAWREWAENNGIDERIISYLAFDQSRLCVEPESSDFAYPTPRSWAFVSRILSLMKTESGGIHQLISACIGSGCAVEFEAWCKVHENLPFVDEIMSGGCTNYPKSHDALYALVSSLTTAVRRNESKITTISLENISKYIKKFPTDFAMSFYKSIMDLESVKLKLMKCPSAEEWFRKNKEYL